MTFIAAARKGPPAVGPRQAREGARLPSATPPWALALILALQGCDSRSSPSPGDGPPAEAAAHIFTDIKLTWDRPTHCFAEGEGFYRSVAPHASCCTPLKRVINYQISKVQCIPMANISPPPVDYICVACGDGKCGKGEDFCTCPADCFHDTCLKEGEAWMDFFGPVGYRCCPGLSFLEWRSPSGSGCAVSPSTFYCTRCGDGTCGKKENRCNCPKDCS